MPQAFAPKNGAGGTWQGRADGPVAQSSIDWSNPDTIHSSLQQVKQDATHNSVYDMTPGKAPKAAPANTTNWGTSGDFSGGQLSTPGYGEQFWQQNGSQMAQPSDTSQAYDQYQSLFSSPNDMESYWNQAQQHAPQNNQQQVYDQYSQQAPLEQYDAAYKQAGTQLDSQMNNQLAARGQYGSSQGVYQMGQAQAALAGDYAQNVANYGLQRQGQLASEAQGADSQSLSNTMGYGSLASDAGQAQLARGSYGLNAANLADTNERANFTTGMGGATSAQNLEQGRLRGGYDDMMSMAGATSGIANDDYNSLFSSDEGLQEQQLAQYLGIPVQNLTQILNNQANNRQSLSTVAGLVGSAYGGNGGGNNQQANGGGSGSNTQAVQQQGGLGENFWQPAGQSSGMGMGGEA